MENSKSPQGYVWVLLTGDLYTQNRLRGVFSSKKSAVDASGEYRVWERTNNGSEETHSVAQRWEATEIGDSVIWKHLSVSYNNRDYYSSGRYIIVRKEMIRN